HHEPDLAGRRGALQGRQHHVTVVLGPDLATCLEPDDTFGQVAQFLNHGALQRLPELAGYLRSTLTRGRRARITRQACFPHCEAAVAGARDQAEPGQQGWMPEIEEIRRRREAALAMGGPQKVARQRDAGRLTVRERIELLADPGSFAEIGALTGF